MSVSGPGRIRYFEDFMGAEIPVANAVAYGTTAGGCNYYIGSLRVVGDLVETDTGAISVAGGLSGVVRISGNDENGKGVGIGTDTMFDVALMGPLIFETRVQRQAVTAGVIYAGFANLIADDIAEPITSTGTAHTFVSTPSLAGFTLDSQLTATADWHCVFAGGDTSNPTDSTTTVTGTSNSRNVNSESVVTAVAGEWDILKVEVMPDALVRWYVNGVLMQEQAGALSTTVDLCAYVACFGTSGAADLDVDYVLIEANRDWTR